VLFIANGFAKNYVGQIKNVLQGRLQVTEARDVQECDVIVSLCTIVSRVGTDVEAALREIPPTTKPALLVVLHQTFDVDYTVPNTQRFVKQGRMVTTDLLFNEDDGLLICSRNEGSLKKATDFLSLNESHRPTNSSLMDWLWSSVLMLFGLFISKPIQRFHAWLRKKLRF
ncbi:hypothetical protein AALO_G00116890, partial [Alosa alosa]